MYIPVNHEKEISEFGLKYCFFLSFFSCSVSLSKISWFLLFSSSYWLAADNQAMSNWKMKCGCNKVHRLIIAQPWGWCWSLKILLVYLPAGIFYGYLSLVEEVHVHTINATSNSCPQSYLFIHVNFSYELIQGASVECHWFHKGSINNQFTAILANLKLTCWDVMSLCPVIRYSPMILPN